MADFFEIDFLDVDAKKSGDAIAIRYSLNGQTIIHVVDGGYSDTGDKLVKHIRQHYGNPKKIDHVIVTHSDRDHACGVTKILEEFEIGTLWMLRPWLYVNELIDRFARFTSTDNLSKRLKELYPHVATLEKLAEDKGIDIFEPFQGAKIGEFTVMAPTKSRYLDLIVQSDKTPEPVEEEKKSAATSFAGAIQEVVAKAVAFLKALWGEEAFASEETSAENEMSVIQYANLSGQKILLTGDAGRSALSEAADHTPTIGLTLPGIDKFQVPHHGSRRNVSTELLDKWLGQRLATKPEPGKELFTAIISASNQDEDHPRKAVVRAMVHRGATVCKTQAEWLCIRHNAPNRPGSVPAPAMAYPDEQEE